MWSKFWLEEEKYLWMFMFLILLWLLYTGGKKNSIGNSPMDFTLSAFFSDVAHQTPV